MRRVLSAAELEKEPISKAFLEEQEANLKNNIDQSSSSDEFTQTQFFQRSLTDHELENDIPVPLLKLVRFFLSKPEFTATVGIFRVNSTKFEEDQIERILAKQHYDRLQEITNPFMIASK